MRPGWVGADVLAPLTTRPRGVFTGCSDDSHRPRIATSVVDLPFTLADY
jgi:hypothetical protein